MVGPEGRDSPSPVGHNGQRPSLPLYLPGNGGLLASVLGRAARIALVRSHLTRIFLTSLQSITYTQSRLPHDSDYLLPGEIMVVERTPSRRTPAASRENRRAQAVRSTKAL